MGDLTADEEGQRPEHRHHDPDQGNNHQPIPRIKMAFFGLEEKARRTDHEQQQNSDQEAVNSA